MNPNKDKVKWVVIVGEAVADHSFWKKNTMMASDNLHVIDGVHSSKETAMARANKQTVRNDIFRHYIRKFNPRTDK